MIYCAWRAFRCSTNGVSIVVFFMYGMVLVLWGVGPILGNGYGI